MSDNAMSNLPPLYQVEDDQEVLRYATMCRVLPAVLKARARVDRSTTPTFEILTYLGAGRLWVYAVFGGHKKQADDGYILWVIENTARGHDLYRGVLASFLESYGRLARPAHTPESLKNISACPVGQN